VIRPAESMTQYSVKRNAGLLALCQALGNVSVAVVMSVSALASLGAGSGEKA